MYWNIEKAMETKLQNENRKLVRKSIVASKEIIIGQRFSTNNLTTKGWYHQWIEKLLVKI